MSFLAVTRILILTGEPAVPLDSASLPRAIKALKGGRINLTAVGVNKESKTELEEITEGQERLLFAQSYDALANKKGRKLASAMKTTDKNSLCFRGTNVLSFSMEVMQFEYLFFSSQWPFR